jgi:hypothetical protein
VTLDTIAKASIAVDYSKSLRDMIAAGRYDWVNDDITPKRFPIKGTGVAQFETKVFHFDRYISSDDAVAATTADDKSNPWEPAKIEVLLAYGTKNPDEQRQYPIIALGSVAEIGADHNVPYLDRSGAERVLRLYWWGRYWNDRCRFLAVRRLCSRA